ncbi:MAG: DUF4810 domain-containing protein [Odoribacteraceae bacterium]|jgi:hypothetical protein|nr:DUF4810 domain-containing protein [Odoribacteraceae bacterium]
MKKIVIAMLIMIGMIGCQIQKPMYSWYNYNATSYNYQKNADAASSQQMIETYQKIVDRQTGSRQTVPPGICADYGFLLLQANKVEEGKAMLMREIVLYPESRLFIERILKMIEQ